MSFKHEKFLTGEYDTSFIDTTPELFDFPKRKDRGTKMLTYIGNVTVNGFPGVEKHKKPVFDRTNYSKSEQTTTYRWYKEYFRRARCRWSCQMD